MWHYFFFAVHLQKKPRTEYTGIEKYVHGMMVRSDLSWIPRGQALAVADEDSDDEEGGFDVSKLEGDELAKEANAATTHVRSRKTTNDNAGEEQPSRDDEAWAKAMDKARDNVDEKILADLAGDTKKEGEPLDFATEEEEDELERALATARETKKKTKEKKIIPANGEQSLFERIAKLEREKPTDMNADNTRNTDENLALTDVAEFCRGVGLDTSGGDDESNAFVAKGRTSKNLKRHHGAA